MKFFAFLALCILSGAILGVQDSFAEQLIDANSTSSTYSVYQNPSIKGSITDEQGNSISGVYVYSLFLSEKAEAMTDEKGRFFLRSSETYPPGEHVVEVYARSELALSRTVVSFEVEEPIIPENKTTRHLTQAKKGLSIVDMMDQVRTYNQEKQQIVNKTLEKNNTSFESQQKIILEPSKANLGENTREELQEKNKDSFANFVKTLDLLMHGIFWDQFEFTQKISEKAYDAKTSALENGKTSLEATKVYQETAAVPQKEVVDYIEEINIKHGFANATVQKQFDDKGKLNRTQTVDDED